MSIPEMAEPGTPPPAYAVVVPLRGVLLALAAAAAVLAGLLFIQRGRTAITLIALATTAAILLAPAVRWLTDKVGSVAAYLALVLGLVGGVGALLGLLTWDVDRQASKLSETLTEAIGRLRESTIPGRVANSLDLTERVQTAFDGAAARWVIGTDEPMQVAGIGAKLIIVTVLAAFMVAGGKDLIAAAITLVRRRSIRRTFHHVAGTGATVGGQFVRRSIAVSVAHGVAAGLAAWGLGLPGALSIGGWVALTATVPILGGPLAWGPVVALAWATHQHPWLAAAIAVALVIGDRLLRRRWVNRALDLGPLLTLIALVIGFALLGIPGAIVALLMMAMAGAAARDWTEELGDAVADLADERHPLSVAGDPARLEPAFSLDPGDGARQPLRVLRLQPSIRTALVVAAVLIGLFAVVRGQQLIASFGLWLVLGTFIAFGVDRPVSFVERRWGWPRVVAIAAVLGAVIVVAGSVIAFSGSALTDAAGTIVDDAPKTVQSLERLPLVGPWLGDNDASGKVEEWITQLPDRVGEGGAVDRVVSTAGDGVVGLLLLGTTMLGVLLDGPRLVRAVARRIPGPRRRKAERLGRSTYQAISNVAAATAFIATLNGAVVMVLALALGIPLAPLLGLWAAAWNVIPQIGGFAAAAPLVVLGFGHSTTAGLIALGVFLTYQTFENHVIQPMVGSKAVDVPPLVLMIGALIGGVLGGFVGAILAGPVLGVAKAAFDELRGDQSRLDDDRDEGGQATSAAAVGRAATVNRQ